MQYFFFFFSLTIQDFKPGNNSGNWCINLFARKPCRRVSKDNERTSGKTTTMPSIIVHFTVPISNSWKSNKARVTHHFPDARQKNAAYPWKKPTTPYIHRLFNLYFRKSVGQCRFVQATQENSYILTFSRYPIFRRIDTCFSSDGFNDTKKKKENVQNDDCKYIAMEILFASLQDRFEEINVSVDTWKVLIVGICLQFSSSSLFFRTFGIDSS